MQFLRFVLTNVRFIGSCNLITTGKKKVLTVLLMFMLLLLALRTVGFSDVPREKLSENLVNANLDGNQEFPDIAADKGDGTLLVAWKDDSNHKVSYRLYDKLGNSLSGVITIETSYVLGNAWPGPAVDELSNDDFFVVWEEGRGGVFGRYVNGDGSILGSEDFLISDQGEKYATPAISVIPSSIYGGDIKDVAMVVWNEIKDGLDDDNVFGRLFKLKWDQAPQAPDDFIISPVHLDDSPLSWPSHESCSNDRCG